MKLPLGVSRYVLALTLLWHSLLAAAPVFAQDPLSTLYIPLIVSDLADCTLNDHEQALVALMNTAPGQGRVAFTCNALLQKAARAQSRDMAARTYCATVDPDGNGPNQRVRSAGYVLPHYYSTAQDANNVQTVACGYPTAQDLWQALLPNDHLEGKGDFWSKQVEYGIAHYEATGGQFVQYWVIITAEPGQ